MFKAVVFDMDGVLRIGTTLTPYSKNILKYLDDKNIKTMVVTNECRYTKYELKEDLHELGLNIPDSTIFYTAGMSCHYYLEKKIRKNKNTKYIIGIVGELGLYKTISTLNKYDNVIINDEVTDDEGVTRILVIGAVNRIKISDLDKILSWLKKDAKVIITCPDTTDPSSKGDFNLGMPNHLLYLVGLNRLTKKYSTGKPNPVFKEIIMKKLGIDNPEEILFIGDTIYTDIQLAEESNFQSALILTGNSNKNTLKNYVISPDYILNDLSELKELILSKISIKINQ